MLALISSSPSCCLQDFQLRLLLIGMWQWAPTLCCAHAPLNLSASLVSTLSLWRFTGRNQLDPWGWLCPSPWKADSNRWTLGWKPGQICPKANQWGDHGDSKACDGYQRSDAKPFLRVPPLLYRLFGGREVEEVVLDSPVRACSPLVQLNWMRK